MALPRAGRKVAGAGLTLIGLIIWVAAAVAPIVAHPEVAFLGVALGGMLTMGGLALSFTSGRRIAARYFARACTHFGAPIPAPRGGTCRCRF